MRPVVPVDPIEAAALGCRHDLAKGRPVAKPLIGCAIPPALIVGSMMLVSMMEM